MIQWKRVYKQAINFIKEPLKCHRPKARNTKFSTARHTHTYIHKIHPKLETILLIRSHPTKKKEKKNEGEI